MVDPVGETRERIRMAGPDDATAILAIYEPFVRTTAVTFEYTVPPVAEMAERIRTVTTRWPWLVLDREDEVVAYAYASTWRSRAAYQWAVETTVYVHPAARRQGAQDKLPVGFHQHHFDCRLLRLFGGVCLGARQKHVGGGVHRRLDRVNRSSRTRLRRERVEDC